MLTSDTPLATSRFHASDLIRESGLLPVSIAIGMPKWPLEYDLVRESPVRSMCAPWGLLGDDLDQDEFRARYEAGLEKHATAKIVTAAEQLAREYGAPGLALLCWEDVRKTWCHRTLLARYLEAAGLGPIREL